MMKYAIATLCCLVTLSVIRASVLNRCDVSAPIKQSQQYSPCAYRSKSGVFIGFGYNLNLHHARNDLAFVGIEPNSIRQGIISHEHFPCDCAKGVCLTPEQGDWLFSIGVDRAQKQVSALIKSSSTMCCDIQAILAEIFFTFGTQRLMDIPDFIFYVNSEQWGKVSLVLLKEYWCMKSSRCVFLSKIIAQGCKHNDIDVKLGCSAPTPQACDATGRYCCAVNNTCCAYNAYGGPQQGNSAYWCCPLDRAVCCSSSNSCCPKQTPVCCGGINSCCYVNYPVCCYPGTAQSYCCAASNPVCLGGQHCGSLDPEIPPVMGKVTDRK